LRGPAQLKRSGTTPDRRTASFARSAVRHWRQAVFAARCGDEQRRLGFAVLGMMHPG
jgi:hypothetical protein